MAKKTKEKTNSKSTGAPTITYEEYYSTLLLAQKIRSENEEALKKAKTGKEKTQLKDILFQRYNIPGSNSSDPKELEKSEILKLNIFIPDQLQFIEDYQNKYDKNVRLIADHYEIPAPFVITKISEIGKYEQYIEQLEKEGKLKELLERSKQPVEKKNQIPKKTESIKENTQSTISETPSPADYVPSEQFIEQIITMQGYCTRLLEQNGRLASQNDDSKKLIEELNALIGRLKNENDGLKKQNAELIQENNSLKSGVSHLTSENETLRSQENSPFTTETERELRERIQVLTNEKQELQDELKTTIAQKTGYRDRLVVAEAQLDLLQSGMKEIGQQIENFDFSFIEPVTQKK